MTAVANTAFTAAQFNTHVRDNLLQTAPAKATGASGLIVTSGLNQVSERYIASGVTTASETTTSTSYTDLTTVGPSVTTTTGGIAIVLWAARLSNNTGGQLAYMSFDLAAAGFVAQDTYSLIYQASAANAVGQMAQMHVIAGIPPGSITVTAKYRAGANTASFANREVVVIPL